jgi:hypothetical protein
MGIGVLWVSGGGGGLTRGFWVVFGCGFWDLFLVGVGGGESLVEKGRAEAVEVLRLRSASLRMTAYGRTGDSVWVGIGREG